MAIDTNQKADHLRQVIELISSEAGNNKTQISETINNQLIRLLGEGGSSTTATYREFAVFFIEARLENATLEVGNEYLIESVEVGDDFSNVGFVSEGVVFVATGENPTTWSNGTRAYDITKTNNDMSVSLLEGDLDISVTYGENEGVPALMITRNDGDFTLGYSTWYTKAETIFYEGGDTIAFDPDSIELTSFIVKVFPTP